MTTLAQKIIWTAKISVSKLEKEEVLKAKKNYINWFDDGITIEESYLNFLNYFNKIK